ncbi:hypothetical protein ABZ369_33955, partial [Streptomyces sp. NPDC005918]|uniref:hypothetical protein n=1 Tax=Streptomyces sp. NPDC005918 TaxID=3155454 RepID=UPI0033FF1DF0
MVQQAWQDGSSGEGKSDGDGDGYGYGGHDVDQEAAHNADAVRAVPPEAGGENGGARGVGRRRFVVGAGLVGTG